RAAAGQHGLLLRVHANIVHRRKIDHQPVIAYSQPARVMPAAADGHQHFLLAAELHRRHDVGHVSAARNQSWAPVDHPVVYLASRVVSRIGWFDQTSAQAGSESCNRRCVQRYLYPEHLTYYAAVGCVAGYGASLGTLRHVPNLAGISDLDPWF